MPEPGWSNDRERLWRWSKSFAKLAKRCGYEVTAAHVERTHRYLTEERKRLVRDGAIGLAERRSDVRGMDG